MRLKIILIIFLIVTLKFQIYGENKKNCVIKKTDDYAIIFYPIKIDGIIRQMEYLYKYEIKFDINIKKPLSILKIEVILNANNDMKNIFDRKTVLQNGKYSFSLPSLMKDKMTINTYTIRFYFENQITNQNQQQNTDNSSNQSQSQTQNNSNLPQYTEYVINKDDFKEENLNEIMN